MSLYAYYNHLDVESSPVLGWYDTDTFTYPTLPDFRDLLEVTQVQWDGRLANPSGWAVVAGELVSYTPPIPLSQQAQILLATKILDGIAIVSASLPDVSATYALDGTSTAQIFQIGSFTNSFGEFPSGDIHQPYPDIVGVPHVFDVPVFIAFLRAVASLISNMQTQAGIMANGGTPSWPQQSASII